MFDLLELGLPFCGQLCGLHFIGNNGHKLLALIRCPKLFADTLHIAILYKCFDSRSSCGRSAESLLFDVLVVVLISGSLHSGEKCVLGIRLRRRSEVFALA